MTPKRFNELVKAAGVGAQGGKRVYRALYLHLVVGKTIPEAADKVEISRQAVSQALKKLPSRRCPKCHGTGWL